LGRSPAGSMVEGLAYLTGYPYGCVEQTMSRALPNAVVARAFRQLGIGDPVVQHELPAQINAGLQRLYKFQTSNGGWGWWENDVAAAYQTAWVVFGLAQTAEAGYEVDETVLARGLSYLLQNHWEFDLPSQAFALYVISLVAPDNSVDVMLSLTKQAEQLDPFGQAALALALHHNGETAAAQAMLAHLGAGAVEDDDGLYWPVANPDGIYERKAMASATRSTALALRAFLAIQPDNPRIPAMVRWLMAHRQAQGWGTTNETAFALLALTDYLFATTPVEAETPYTVTLNDTVVAGGTINALQPSVQITLTAAQLAVGQNSLQIATAEGTPLYYRLVEQSYAPQGFQQRAGVVTVTRRYFDAQTGEALTAATVGQLVQVQLSVQLSKPASYLLVEDRLPGGLIALNERLGADWQRTLAESHPYYNDDLRYNQKEIRG
ncbi:MAG: hypothetical protein KDE31_15515, partial [Caldilineaceae bacterium]|nr:hypothetical protein [Caldilineaceae bacterium]